MRDLHIAKHRYASSWTKIGQGMLKRCSRERLTSDCTGTSDSNSELTPTVAPGGASIPSDRAAYGQHFILPTVKRRLSYDRQRKSSANGSSTLENVSRNPLKC